MAAPRVVALAWALGALAGCRQPPEVNATLGAGVVVAQAAQVSDGRALGSSSQPKLIVDGGGRGFAAIRTHVGSGQEQSFGIGLLRTRAPVDAPGPADVALLTDAQGVPLHRSPQGAPSFDTLGDGTFLMAFTGGSVGTPAHQLRLASFRGSPDLVALAASQLVTVTGFELAYPSASGAEPWQEFPSVAFDSAGRLHVAWEARSAARTSGGRPSPAIAHLVASGATQPIAVASPPFVDPAGGFREQHRPVLVADDSGGMHLFASGGPGGGAQQALYGHLAADGSFSGFAAIAPNAGLDQRHVVAARDSSGTLWAAWRQGVPGDANQRIAVVVARMKPANPFEPPIQVGDPSENAGAPSIAAYDGAARLAFVSWVPGSQNSESRVDNGFPDDDGLVEGSLRLFEKRADAPFRRLAVDLRTTASYPAWATGPAGVPGPAALLFTEGFATSCPGADCVALQLGAVQEPLQP